MENLQSVRGCLEYKIMKVKLLFSLLIICVALPCFADEIRLGNSYYSRQNISFSFSFSGGLYGTQDFFSQNSKISYTFLSKNRHSFKLRFSQKSNFPGLFSGNTTDDNFSLGASTGFEYMFKIFPTYGGISVFLETGYVWNGFYLYAGAGIGDEFRNGLFYTIEYAYNRFFENDILFCFSIVNYFSLHIELGMNLDITPENIDEPPLNIKAGIFPGFYCADKVRCNFGGGVTLNDKIAVGFYLSTFMQTRLPF